MNHWLARSIRTATLALVFLPAPILVHGQTSSDNLPSIDGKVCDAQTHALSGVTVTLESSTQGSSITATTDAHGHFAFSKLPVGTYTLSVKFPGFNDTTQGPFTLAERETKSVLLSLNQPQPAVSSTNSSTEIPFSDDTHFTVAGVMDTTSLGGHGSDPIRRNSDALSKDAAHLSNVETSTPDEATLRARLAKEDTADLRFQLAEAEEKSGHSLDAVKDYQRAAKMEPTEPHLFAWGAELLLHRAFDPSIAVFTRGQRIYPNSARMVLGLGSATYARGSSDEAKQIFLQACDVNPSDPTPYLFLGKVQTTESSLPTGWTERLKRFVDLYPENAMAHYFYAVALTKHTAENGNLALAESQLKTAIDLNPHLGDAYLELGILASQQGDYTKAIALLQKALEYTPLPDDAHYRLAQVYRRTGEMGKARQETELYKEISEKKNQQVERERHELQQFVYTLREQNISPRNSPFLK